jgi:cystathionine beta-lyase/cystathionine gamma-synthase
VTNRPETDAITAGQELSRSLSPALWPSTVWSSDGLDATNARATALRSDEFYGRYANPTVTQFEHALATLEGAESAVAFGSGMGALASVVLAFCGNGSHIVAQDSLYGGTYSFLDGPCRRFGIDVTFVDAKIPGAFKSAVIPGKTMLVIAETPSNPCLQLVDLDELGAIKGPFTLVDSTLGTPLGQQPLRHGVDMVMHSATKGIGGHNDAMIGVVAGEKDLIDAVWQYGVLHGASASPYDAHNALRGIKTLDVRTTRQATSALSIATSLSRHRAVQAVHYPFLESHPQHQLARQQMRHGGSVLSFELRDGITQARALIDSLTLARPATSFGGPETLVCHPATSTHIGLPPEILSRIGISDGLIRVSVGLEHHDDILNDLIKSLA